MSAPPPADKVDRARALLALAAGTDREEEARTAALQAARLIKEHAIPIGKAALEADEAAELRQLRALVARANRRIAELERDLAMAMGLSGLGAGDFFDLSDLDGIRDGAAPPTARPRPAPARDPQAPRYKCARCGEFIESNEPRHWAPHPRDRGQTILVHSWC
jgi:hypothetical protein